MLVFRFTNCSLYVLSTPCKVGLLGCTNIGPGDVEYGLGVVIYMDTCTCDLYTY